MKRKLIFLTRSTLPPALADSTFNTSSQAFEVNLITSLASMIDVTVVYIGDDEEYLQTHRSESFTVHLPRGQVEYFCFGPVGYFASLEFCRFLKEIGSGHESAIITTGYYLNEIACLAWVKNHLLKGYSIVFDTHVQSTQEMSLPKRWLANGYFEVGFFLLRCLHGIVVLNDAFIFSKERGLRYHKMKIGKLFHGRAQSNIPIKRLNARLRFLFAGTLNADNGVRLILNYLQQYPTENIEISFFGYGQLLGEIKNRQLTDSRIKYGGILNDPEIDVKIAEHDFLLCLRDPESPVCRYSFPSKLIKFMGSGVPVICNVFPGLDPEYWDQLLLLREYTILSLADTMNMVQVKNDFRSLGVTSRDFIDKNHDWSAITDQLIEFIFACDYISHPFPRQE